MSVENVFSGLAAFRNFRHLLHALIVILLTVTYGFAGAAQDSTGPRIALIIANGDYISPKDRLSGPLDDAVVLRRALEAKGFTGIDGDRAPSLLPNGTNTQMRHKLQAFKTALDKAGPLALGVLYYAGHGGSDAAGNENYILPVDTPDVAAAPIEKYGIGVRWITATLLSQIDTNRRPSIAIVVDACRTPQGVTASGRGAAPVRPMVQPDTIVPNGMLVALSTRAGQSAPDAGYYANILARKIEVSSGKPLATLFDEVMREVAQKTGQVQVPVHVSQIIETVCMSLCSDGKSTLDVAASLDFIRRARDERSIGDIGQGNALASLIASNYDMSGMSFRGLHFSRSPIKAFEGMQYRSGEGEGFTCDDCVLDGAEWQKTKLSYGSIRGSKLNRAKMEGAVLDFVDAHRIQAEGLLAPKTRWMFANLESSNLASAVLTESMLAFANLRNANLANADLRASSFAGADLSGADLRGAKLDDVDFSNTALDGAQFDPKEIAKACVYADGVRGEVRFINEIPTSKFEGGIENQVVMQRVLRRKQMDNKFNLRFCDRTTALVASTKRNYNSHYGFYPSALPVKFWARTALERMGAEAENWHQSQRDRLD